MMKEDFTRKGTSRSTKAQAFCADHKHMRRAVNPDARCSKPLLFYFFEVLAVDCVDADKVTFKNMVRDLYDRACLQCRRLF